MIVKKPQIIAVFSQKQINFNTAIKISEYEK